MRRKKIPEDTDIEITQYEDDVETENEHNENDNFIAYFYEILYFLRRKAACFHFSYKRQAKYENYIGIL